MLCTRRVAQLARKDIANDGRQLVVNHVPHACQLDVLRSRAQKRECPILVLAEDSVCA